MDNQILSALNALPVADMDRESWIKVGMALKDEGFPCSVWDDWSRNDKRYHPGECQRKWDSFNGSGSHVKGGTIIQMAKDRGWTVFGGEDGCMGWNDDIEYDGKDGFTGFTLPDAWSPTEDLKTYLKLLFKPDEHVAYVSNDVWQDQDGKYVPSKGAYDRTAGELIASLEKHPDDIGATIGDCKEEAGGWIRFNPVDGNGVKNENVTRFTYALVESDTLSIQEQDILFRKLELPIAVMVHSGGKSLHAIVKVDATDYEEYRKRVEFLYDFLQKQGITIDRQNRNPSRLSRMPGVTRKGNRQYIVATNIGRKSWTDWLDFAEGVSDELPGMESFAEYTEAPALPEELIKGILRRGHKMLISGSSKAGKSFLLMELCICIAEGRPWLGFECRKGKVLYVNLEIDPASCVNRFFKIYEAMGIPRKAAEDIVIWNLRGHAVPLDQLVPKLIRRVRDQHFDAIVIDPIYKVLTGDENSASDMAAFTNNFDKICNETGCSAIYCHHHSKGAQGAKRAMDRASGSGVFARDPDAQLDMIELELTEEIKNFQRDGNSTAWRLESSLREFANIIPVNFWFEYPIHRVDDKGILGAMPATGTAEAGKMKNGKSKSADQAAEEFRNAYNACNISGKVTIKDLTDYLGVTDKTIYARLKKMEGEFTLDHGEIKPVNADKKVD